MFSFVAARIMPYLFPHNSGCTMIPIDLLAWQEALQVKTIDQKPHLFDPIRRKWLVLQPEELVRQLFLLYLLQEKKYPANRIRLEMGLKINGLIKRCDILVFDPAVQPFLLVECKAPSVPIDAAVFQQLARYNLALQVPFWALTNGATTYAGKLQTDPPAVLALPALPDWPF